ncbi:ABC transporter ATP-binding protein [Clostridium sp.]|uniref:ABC transporter ATP-binding protein n=1 Tax=Clostridium sp. TaxID=1506 RepID=UPI002FC7E6F6
MSVIEINDLSKSYGKGENRVFALDNINITIEEGDMVAVMGPSGSGKSTLLNMLGLLDKPTEGDYLLEGNDTVNLTVDEISLVRNEKIGFVFQNFNLLNKQNLIYNVILPLTYSKNKKDMKARGKEMLNKVGLESHINKTPNELSGGQKQRVAIARALINNPKIILADEPTGALDKKTGEDILELFDSLNKEGQTIIIVTHDINIANRCKRIINIVDGKIV